MKRFSVVALMLCSILLTACGGGDSGGSGGAVNANNSNNESNNNANSSDNGSSDDNTDEGNSDSSDNGSSDDNTDEGNSNSDSDNNDNNSDDSSGNTLPESDAVPFNELISYVPFTPNTYYVDILGAESRLYVESGKKWSNTMIGDNYWFTNADCLSEAEVIAHFDLPDGVFSETDIEILSNSSEVVPRDDGSLVHIGWCSYELKNRVALSKSNSEVNADTLLNAHDIEILLMDNNREITRLGMISDIGWLGSGEDSYEPDQNFYSIGQCNGYGSKRTEYSSNTIKLGASPNGKHIKLIVPEQGEFTRLITLDHNAETLTLNGQLPQYTRYSAFLDHTRPIVFNNGAFYLQLESICSPLYTVGRQTLHYTGDHNLAHFDGQGNEIKKITMREPEGELYKAFQDYQPMDFLGGYLDILAQSSTSLAELKNEYLTNNPDAELGDWQGIGEVFKDRLRWKKVGDDSDKIYLPSAQQDFLFVGEVNASYEQMSDAWQQARALINNPPAGGDSSGDGEGATCGDYPRILTDQSCGDQTRYLFLTAEAYYNAVLENCKTNDVASADINYESYKQTAQAAENAYSAFCS